MTNLNLVINKIIREENTGYSHVSVSRELFDAMHGIKPALPYETKADKSGNGIRIFTINGTPIYSRYDKTTYKTIFIMKTKDAKAHLDPEAETPLEFSADAFSTAVVYSV